MKIKMTIHKLFHLQIAPQLRSEFDMINTETETFSQFFCSTSSINHFSFFSEMESYLLTRR